MIDAELKKKTITGISNLPTLPEVATRLMQMVNDPDTSAADAAKVISRDVGITSKVLRMANSAFYGIPRTITTVQNAVVLLGMKVVNSLVLSVSVGEIFPSKDANVKLERKAFWTHSLACAVAGKLIAQKIKRPHLVDPEESFCSGLLHDIGKLVLDNYFVEEYVQAKNDAQQKNESLYETEKVFFGYTHTDVGDWLTSKWELPRDLRIPIIYHHQPADAPSSKEQSYLIHCADYASHKAGFNVIKNEKAFNLDESYKEVLEITEEDLEKIIAAIPEEVEKIHSSFSFS